MIYATRADFDLGSAVAVGNRRTNTSEPSDCTAKTYGGKVKGGRILEGRTCDEMLTDEGTADG